MRSDLEPQDLSHAHALPARFYTQPDMPERDARLVLGPSWQLAGHLSQIADVGDHLVLEAGALPVVVVRESDSSVRAYHNVCRHRAAPLALCAGKGARSLRCRYHGWTYGLDGALRSATEMGTAEGFDAHQIRLPELRVEVWQDLVFVGGEGAIEFSSLARGLDGPLRSLSPRGYRFHQRVSYDVACNWKVYCDNYLEGYHVPHIHPSLNRLLDYKSYVTETADWFSWQYSPLDSADALYGSGDALYYFIYPNTMLNLLPGRLQTNRVVPRGLDHCRVDFDYFYADDDRPEALARRAADHPFAAEVQEEDIAICEQVQRGLASGSYESGRLNPLRENAVHHFHELLRRAYRSAR